MREASGVTSNLRSLPPGGGGVSSLGDRFQPDLVKGTGNYSIPLHFPTGPNELKPSLALVYSTGYGNGVFGLGWQLNPMRIERRTDRGVPNYGQGDKQDEFILAGSGLLVPVGEGRYRPISDNAHWLIQRTEDHWEVRDGLGRILRFGVTPEAREECDGRVFAWCLEEEIDAAGNKMLYTYQKDGNVRYFQELRYSIFRILIHYGERPDVLRNGRSGFLRETRLRATTIDLHCSQVSPTEMRSYKLDYRQAHNQTTLLDSVTLTADADGIVSQMPALTFAYTELDMDKWSVDSPEAYVSLPSIEDPDTKFVDLTGNGLPDVLSTSGGRALRWENTGEGTFNGPFVLDGIPTMFSLERGNVAFADLNGNGRVDLFGVDQPLQLAFQGNAQGGFESQPLIFSSTPSVRLSAANTRLVDVDGDGIIGLLSTESTHHLLFRHNPGVGFEGPQAVERIHDLDQFPDVSFQDRNVKLGDMTGDGLQDMVVLRSGYVAYWPYLGNGSWGSRVVMMTPPTLPDGFREDRLHLIDIDGCGTSDVVYVDHSRVIVWFNQSGNGFTDPVEVPIGITNNGRVIPVDVYGNGRPGLAWNFPPSGINHAGFLVLRFNPGVAPYLMQQVDNGMGGRFQIQHTTSTEMRCHDRVEGRFWPGELPIVIHVVEAIYDIDSVTGRRSERHFRYHDGVWDGLQREFRGFSEVDVITPGDESIPSNRQTVTHFTGDPHHPDILERTRQRALVGAVEATNTFELIDNGWDLIKQSHQTWETRTEFDDGVNQVLFPHVTRIETIEHGRSDPNIIDTVEFHDFDEFGNPGRRTRHSHPYGGAPDEVIGSEERFTYTINEPSWIVKLPARMEYRGSDGIPHGIQIRFYDGLPHNGLDEGGVENGLVTRVLELRMLDTKLPTGYAEGHDFSSLGFEHSGVGDTAGWYVTVYSVERDSCGNVSVSENPTGETTTINYDGDGVYPTSASDAIGAGTFTTFDPRSGEPSEVILPNGGVVRHQFDSLGRLEATFESDANGNPQLVKCWITSADAPISVSSITPRSPGRQRSEFVGINLADVAGANVSRVLYDGFGQEAYQMSRGPDDTSGSHRFVLSGHSTSNPNGLPKARYPIVFVPDLGDPPTSLVPPQPAYRFRYDTDGNVLETETSAGERFRVNRDTLTRQHFQGAAAGEFHDVANTGPPHAPGPYTRIDRFDARGRLVAVEERRDDTAVVTTRYRLAVDGRLSAILDGSWDPVVTYDFVGPGPQIRATHRDIGTRTYYYDAADRLVERIEPDGTVLRFAHDTRGRITRIDHDPGSGDIATVRRVYYDTDPGASDDGRFLSGRIALVEEGESRIRFSYNPGGKTTREEYTIAGEVLLIDRSYDLQGKLTQILYPDGATVEYSLDDCGAITDIPGFLSEIDYDANGIVQSYRQGNDVEITRPLDPNTNRLTQIAAIKNGEVLRQLNYWYDENGAVDSITDVMPTGTEHHKFQYDSMYRLTAFERLGPNPSGPVLQVGEYNYDDLGNLQSIEEIFPQTMLYEDVVRPGRVTSVVSGGATSEVLYNNRGHIRKIGSLSNINYDPLDRATNFERSDGTAVRLVYDHENRRLLKDVETAGAIIRSRYVTGLYEQHENHSLRHIFFGREMVATERVDADDHSVVFYLSDNQGTLVLTTDENGAILENDRVSPFGSPWAGSGELNRFLGRIADEETGLVHLGARFYSPQIGRFISADWYALEHPEKAVLVPQAYNVYSYAINNPIAFKDPSGLFVSLIIGVIAAIAAGSVAISFAVGFVGGLIYGLATGQGWGSLLTALETGLTTTVGMLLGGFVGGPFGAVMGAMNGLISGMHGIYDWTSIEGWGAFLTDSTWGLIGTSLGNFVHIVNVFWPDSNYRHDLSHRQNRHVYEGGVALKPAFAFTMGNVISNAGLGGGNVNLEFLAEHEELHIWQSRLFGPLYQGTYVAWATVGFFTACVAWWFVDDVTTLEDFGSLVETASYYNNPFEYWAYKNHGNWDTNGAHPELKWS